jgi:salicylate hydroxylase
LGERRNIVIAGAGIGGLTAALALAGRGFPTIVCERSDRLSEVGAGIQLSPNVSNVLAGLGIGNALAETAATPRTLDIRSGISGRLLSSVSFADMPRRYGHPWRVMARSELLQVLAGAVTAHPEIELRLGTAVADFAAGPGDLLVGTENREGRSIVPALALIGAHGIATGLREKIDGAESAKPIGRIAWRATIPARAAGNILPADAVGLWLGPDAHLVHYPIAGGRTINIVAIVEEEWTGVGWSEPGDPYELAPHFKRWGNAARAIVGAPSEWRKWAILSVDPTGPWVQDRVALIGDAAHAMPPFLAQGAAMAIEDAAVLAASFAADPDNPAAALFAYEAARKPRVVEVHKAAFDTGMRYHYDGMLATMRNAALWLAGSSLALRTNDWIYGWKLDS